MTIKTGVCVMGGAAGRAEGAPRPAPPAPPLGGELRSDPFVYARPFAITIFLLIIKSRMRQCKSAEGIGGRERRPLPRGVGAPRSECCCEIHTLGNPRKNMS